MRQRHTMLSHLGSTLGSLAFLVVGALGALCGVAEGAPQSGSGVESFDGFAEGTHDVLETKVGKFTSPDRSLRIMQRLGEEPGNYALRLGAPRDGQKMPTIEVRLELPGPAAEGTVLSMDLQRAARRKRFQLQAEFVGGPEKSERQDLTQLVALGEFRSFGLVVPAGSTALLFHLTAPPTIGVDLDHFELRAPESMDVLGVTARHITKPAILFEGGAERPSALAELSVRTDGALDRKVLDSIRFRASAEGVEVVSVRILDGTGAVLAEAPPLADSPWVTLEPKAPLAHGLNTFQIEAVVKPTAAPEGREPVPGGAGNDRYDLAGAPFALDVEAVISGVPMAPIGWSGTPARTAAPLGPSGHVVLGTALLPARGAFGTPANLVGALTLQTDSGPRVRFVQSSVGGQLKFGAWLEKGLAPDWDTYAPTFIQERPKGTVHVFFMAQAPGEASAPEVWRTRSDDRGATWAAASKLEWNIPSTVRGPEEGVPCLLGGRGIQSGNGAWALLVAAPKEGGQRLLLSRDQGKTFQLSTSTEVPSVGGALVELGNGAFLVDTHLPGSNRRYLVSTINIAETWTDALSKRRPLLPCAGLGAAIVHVGRDFSNAADWRLVFANVALGPDVPSGLTLRGSNDNGDNWFDRVSLLLDEGDEADLPALAVLDEDTICVLYRSSAGEPCVQYIEYTAVVEKIVTFFDVFGAGSGLKR